MTAHDSKLRNRGGHRPHLHSNETECQPSHDLASPGLSAGSRISGYCSSVEPIHIAKAARVPLLSISGWIGGGVPARQRCEPTGLHRNWTRQEEPVKNVIELRPDLELDVPFAVDGKDPAEAEWLRALPLPPEVVVVRRRGSESPGRRIDPCIRVQHELLCRIDAMTIRVFRKQRLARNSVPEGRSSAPVSGVIG